jgi:putative transposase
MDRHTRERLGWQVLQSGKVSTAASALEQALIARFGTLGRTREPFFLHSDYGWVFASPAYTAPVRCYGLRRAFIPPLSA